MSTMPRQERPFRLLDKTQLQKIRAKAIRSGAWFKVLSRIDRVLVDLTLRVANNIRSFTLANSILIITRKLQKLLESRISQTITDIGFPMAHRLSLFAQKWGNKRAQEWDHNLSFAQYLAVMTLNGHPLTATSGIK
jgi:hypothetical protein